MSQITLSQLSAILDNVYVNNAYMITENEDRAAFGWLELNPLTWLISQKHKTNKSWDQLPADAFKFYQIGKKLRESLGCKPISESVLKKFLADLKPYEAGVHTNASKMALRNLENKGLEATDENITAAYNNASAIAANYEQKRVDDTKASFDELLQLINGDFGKKAEKLADYASSYAASERKLFNKIEDAVKGAYSALKREAASSTKPDEIDEIAKLIDICVDFLESRGNNMDIIDQRYAAYQQGVALFDRFKK